MLGGGIGRVFGGRLGSTSKLQWRVLVSNLSPSFYNWKHQSQILLLG